MVMDDTQSIINAYKSGELNFISADYTVMDEYKDSDELIASPSQTSYYVLFNVNEAPLTMSASARRSLWQSTAMR